MNRNFAPQTRVDVTSTANMNRTATNSTNRAATVTGKTNRFNNMSRAKAKEIVASDKAVPIANPIVLPVNTQKKLDAEGLKFPAVFIDGEGEITSNIKMGDDTPIYLLNAIKTDFEEASFEDRLFIPVLNTLPALPTGRIYVTEIIYSFGDKPVGSIRVDLASSDLEQSGSNDESFYVTITPISKSGRIAIISTKKINGVYTPFVSRARQSASDHLYLKFSATEAALTVRVLSPSESASVIEQVL